MSVCDACETVLVFLFILKPSYPDIYSSLSQDEPSSLDKAASREPVSLTHSAYSLAATAYSQDQLYNGGLNYSYRGYGGLCASMQHPVSLTTATAQTNGERGSWQDSN